MLAPLGTQQMVLVAAAAAVMKSKGPGQSLNGQPAVQNPELAMVSLKTCLLAMWYSEERVVCPLSISQASEGRLELQSTYTCCPGPGGSGELRRPNTRLSWGGVSSVPGRLRCWLAKGLPAGGSSGLPQPEAEQGQWGLLWVFMSSLMPPWPLTIHPRHRTGSSPRQLPTQGRVREMQETAAMKAANAGTCC